MAETTGAVVPFDGPVDGLIELFENGEFEIEGRMPYSSNLTLLVHFTADDDLDVRAIYKPGQGERPLWDFPDGLYRREVATFRLSQALGWSVIPPTTLATGMMGEGSVQAFVNADFSEHYFTLLEARTAIPDLQKLCVLDFIANNTDRKSGHCLLGPDGHVYGIDNGLSFHAEFKLRTVIWDFVGDPIPVDVLDDVTAFVQAGPPAELAAMLNPFEQDAMLTRARAIVEEGHFPEDDTDGHRWPWPLV
jgi:uncharacterized repeat protein (TIGR03843 family)